MKLFATADNPIPAGADCGQFAGQDGVAIRYALWPHLEGQAKGTVCLFGGRGEYIEKYFETVSDLRARGFAVATMDWRGQGGSGRLLRNSRKGFVDSFADYDADLARFMHDIVMPDCPPPYFGLGHSTGGHVLLRSVRLHSGWFDRMVLVSPLINLPMAPVKQSLVCRVAEMVAFLGGGSRFAPGQGDLPSDAVPFARNEMTSDKARHARNAKVLKLAPELGLGGATYQWLHAACRSMGELARPDFPSLVKVPLLILGGTADTIVSTSAMERLALEVRIGSCLMIPGARHEILMERDAIRDEFWAAFDEFVPGTPGFGSPS